MLSKKHAAFIFVLKCLQNSLI